MKVIDLLNKIANGEEVPEKIKYKDFIYEYYKQETVIDYRCYDKKTEMYGYLSSCVDYETFNILNNEIEIIEDTQEEDNKRINRLQGYVPARLYLSNKDYDEDLRHVLENIGYKVNEIIDKVNGVENE